MLSRPYLAALGGSALSLLVACGGGDSPQPQNDGSGQGDGEATAGDGTSGQLDGGRGNLDAGKSNASTGYGDGGATTVDGGKAPAGDSGSTNTKSDSGTSPPGNDSGTTTNPNRLKPKCMHKDTQLMIIGDSYINWVSHTFPQDIVTVSNQHWRMEAIGGYSMGSGGIGFIGDEYKQSIAADPDCHTILMDGGGNDILVADPSIDPNRDCLTSMSTTLPQCQTIIDKALAAADTLLQSASKAGIRDVVYFFYPHVPEGTLLGGPSPNTILDFALPQVQKFCDGVEAETNGATRCTFIDMRPVFQGHDDWFFPGDIHPVSAGSQAMAKKIWEVMTDKCIGQPASATCCEQ